MKKVVCVLGMHRSGTSMLANIISKLGVFFGDENALIGKRIGDNDEGFFENKAIVNKNEKFLKQMNTEWFDSKEINEDILKNLSDEDIKKILDEEFSEHDLYGIKDPRMCLLLPLYKKVWEENKDDVYCIIIIRNPYEVAMSLKKRNNFSIEKGLQIWYKYIVYLFLYTQDIKKKKIVFFDELIGKSENIVGELARFLEINSKIEEAQKCVKNKLYHNKDLPYQYDLIDELYTVIKNGKWKNISWQQKLEELKKYQEIYTYKQDEKPLSFVARVDYRLKNGQEVSKYELKEEVINLDRNGEFLYKDICPKETIEFKMYFHLASEEEYWAQLTTKEVFVNQKKASCQIYANSKVKNNSNTNKNFLLTIKKNTAIKSVRLKVCLNFIKIETKLKDEYEILENKANNLIMENNNLKKQLSKISMEKEKITSTLLYRCLKKCRLLN